MKVIQLKGQDQRLYDLVAYLVMDEEVLKYNLNYPYKTSSEYCWFIATDKNKTLGFIPVKLKEEKAIINNYYVANDDSVVFCKLLKKVIQALSSEFEIESVTQIQHVSFFEESGFSTVLCWKRYVKMKKMKDEKKRL